jgi:hypothetical protein
MISLLLAAAKFLLTALLGRLVGLLPIFGGLLGRIPLIPTFIVLAGVLVYTTGYVKGQSKCEINQLQADKKETERHEKVEKKVGSVGGSALDKRMRKCCTRD